MNYGTSRRSRYVAAASAFAVTALLASSLVESFDPAQLKRIEQKSAAEPAVAVLDWRRRVRPYGEPIRRRA